MADLLFKMVATGTEITESRSVDRFAEENLLTPYEELDARFPIEFQQEAALREVEGCMRQLRILVLKQKMRAMQREIDDYLRSDCNDEAFEIMAERRKLAHDIRRLEEKKVLTRKVDQETPF
jgi:hypothetical protein